VGTSKTLEQYEGSTISLYGCGASGAYALGPERIRRRRRRRPQKMRGVLSVAPLMTYPCWLG